MRIPWLPELVPDRRLAASHPRRPAALLQCVTFVGLALGGLTLVALLWASPAAAQEGDSSGGMGGDGGFGSDSTSDGFGGDTFGGEVEAGTGNNSPGTDSFSSDPTSDSHGYDGDTFGGEVEAGTGNNSPGTDSFSFSTDPTSDSLGTDSFSSFGGEVEAGTGNNSPGTDSFSFSTDPTSDSHGTDSFSSDGFDGESMDDGFGSDGFDGESMDDGFGGDGLGGGIEADTGDASTVAGTDGPGPTGFEGSPEVGPTHAHAIDSDPDGYGYTEPDRPTGFEGSPEVGPLHAEMVGTAWADEPEGYTPGFATAASWQERNPEVGPHLAEQIRQQEQLGWQDGQRAREQLAGLGFGPNDRTFAALEASLRDVVAPQMVDADNRSGAYAARFYEAVGPTFGMTDALRAIQHDRVVDVANGVREQRTLARGAGRPTGFEGSPEVGPLNAELARLDDVPSQILGPLSYGLADATRSPVSPTGVLQALTAASTPNQQRGLAELGFVSPADRFDPQFLADAIAPILTERNVSYVDQSWPDPELADPRLGALQALAQNPEAAVRYGTRGPAYVAGIVRPAPPAMAPLRDPLGARPFGQPYAREHLDRLAGEYAAGVIEGYRNAAIADLVAVPGTSLVVAVHDPERYSQVRDIYADMVRVAGARYLAPEPVGWDPTGIVDAFRQGLYDQGWTSPPPVPDPVSRELATMFGLYADDIGQAALRAIEGEPRRADDMAAQDFSRTDLVDFARTIAADETAARLLGGSIQGWTAQRAAGVPTATDLAPGQIEAMVDPVAAVMDALEDGFALADETDRLANRAAATGYRHAIGSLPGGAIAAIGAKFTSPLLAGPLGALAAGSGSLVLQGTDIYGATGPPLAFDADDFQSAVVQGLTRDLAVAVAQERGLLDPVTGRVSLQPGEYSSFLSRTFTGGNPAGYLDRAADTRFNRDPGDQWGQATPSGTPR